MNGDDKTRARACELVWDACIKHGLFQVTNHGVDPVLIREAYEETDSIFRMSYQKKMIAARKLECSYRPCDNSNLSIAKGPHSDPVCITILHQDQDSSLEVLMNGKWLVCEHHPEASVVNRGDTFQADLQTCIKNLEFQGL
ncbi:hypothetical protein K1719_014561 [Acacia pycnantha]|nr:hypothetical protein K1719_014561 [Acacia pycnantha]